jgi:circadian clock protein KaiC
MSDRISTGIEGLDQILFGGLLRARTYLVRGGPGTGKTTTGLHFLAAGIVEQEKVLFISFVEPEHHVRADATRLGLAVENMTFLDLSPEGSTFSEVEAYDLFSPAEIERDPMTRKIAQQIEQNRPARVFVDCFGQMRYLASDGFHFSRLAQAFFRFVTESGATLVIANDAEVESDRFLRSASDGVILLESTTRGRAVRVIKFRGSDFHPGTHPMRLTSSGIQVLPNAT